MSDAVLGSAFDVAVVRMVTSEHRRGPSYSAEVQKAALQAKVAGCAALALATIAFARPISRILFHQESAATLLLLSVLALLALLVLRSLQTAFQVSGRFVLYGLTDILHSAAKFGGIGLLLAFGTVQPVRVLLLYAMGPLAVAATLLLTAGRSILQASFQWGVCREVLGLAKWYFGAAAAGSTTSRMDILLVSAVAGTAQAGVYSSAQTVVLPLQLLGMYMGVVLAPRIIPLWESGRLASIYWPAQGALAGISILIYALAFLTTGWAVATLLPATFAGAAAIILWLLPSALAAFVNFPWTVSFLMFAHPRLLLLFDLCALPVLFLIYRFCISSYGPMGAAAVTSAFALLKTAAFHIVAGWTLKKRTGPAVSGTTAAPNMAV